MSTSSQQLGRYALRELLGRGSIAEIWKAFDLQSQEMVTIKLFRPNLQNDANFLARFQHEAQVVATLHHPHIVRVRDFQTLQTSESEGIAYFVLDYVEGVQLVDYIRSTSASKKFPPKEALVQLFAAIGSALDYAHHQGVIHRNLNPTNILLNTRHGLGEPLLTDFGIATILSLSSSPIPGMFQGDPAYLAPEQIQGYPGNELSDLYSLGVILYELCTGGLPFSGKSPSRQLTQHVGSTPTPPALLNPHIPPPLTMVLLRSLARDPAERFPSAAALVEALAEALNVPQPEGLSAQSAPSDDMYIPTYITSPDSGTSSPMAPVSPPWSSSISGGSAPLPAVALSTPINTSSSTLLTPPSATPSMGAVAHTPVFHTGGMPVVAQPPIAPSSPPAAPKRRRRGLVIALLALLLLLIGGAAAGVFYLLPRGNTAPAGPTIVGHAFFFNSGQFKRNTSQGMNDGLQITFQQIAPAASGKAYYAWLLTDSSPSEASGPSLLLGILKVNQGHATLSYTNPDHSNLLAIASRLLVTEEDASISPVNPSLDKSTWRYVAELPRTVDPNTKFSVLDHLRHLLAKDPKLEALGLHGGLTPWLVRNSEDIMVWSESARDDQAPHSLGLLRDQVIRILDVLDSSGYVQTLGDVPANTPLKVDPLQARVAMFTFDSTNQDPPGYLDHIGRHLRSMVNAPGVTSDQVQNAKVITKSLNNITNWLQKVRQDAVQLEQLSQQGDTALLSPEAHSILNDMAAQALYAYVGQLDPRTNKEVAGIAQVANNIERLATFNITLYAGK